MEAEESDPKLHQAGGQYAVDAVVRPCGLNGVAITIHYRNGKVTHLLNAESALRLAEEIKINL